MRFSDHVLGYGKPVAMHGPLEFSTRAMIAMPHMYLMPAGTARGGNIACKHAYVHMHAARHRRLSQGPIHPLKHNLLCEGAAGLSVAQHSSA